MKKVKISDLRRAEIIAVAREMFSKKGFTETSIDDIVNELGMAKGTFYYYFKSKESILESVIDELIIENVDEINKTVDDETLGAIEKLTCVRKLLSSRYQASIGIINQVKQMENSEFRYRWLIRSVEQKTSVIAKVIEQGVKNGEFVTGFPIQFTEIVVLSAIFLFDPKIFPCTENEYITRLKAIQEMMEKSLSLPLGTLAFISDHH